MSWTWNMYIDSREFDFDLKVKMLKDDVEKTARADPFPIPNLDCEIDQN